MLLEFLSAWLGARLFSWLAVLLRAPTPAILMITQIGAGLSRGLAYALFLVANIHGADLGLGAPPWLSGWFWLVFVFTAAITAMEWRRITVRQLIGRPINNHIVFAVLLGGLEAIHHAGRGAILRRYALSNVPRSLGLLRGREVLVGFFWGILLGIIVVVVDIARARREMRKVGKGTGAQYAFYQVFEEVIHFLDDTYGLSVFTFTELIAYVFAQIDAYLLGKSYALRQEMTKLFLRTYVLFLEERFRVEGAEHYQQLTGRVKEYIRMLRKRSEEDILWQLEFWISQAALRGDYYQEGSPAVISTFCGYATRRTALRNFLSGISHLYRVQLGQAVAIGSGQSADRPAGVR